MVNLTEEPSPGEADPRLGLVRDLFAGRYEIDDKLPWGGLAIIYGAREPGRDVAVSVLPLDCAGAPEIEQAFEIWAAGLEDFNHPGHLSVTDSGVQHGVPYLELESIPGATLWERSAGLSAMEALRVAVDIAEVVEAAHELDLVHWDLTPANVLLDGDGAASRVRVLGFGVAPLLFSTRDDDSTGPTGKGSGPKARRFMAPERLANAEGGLRADQYSLGALVYFLLRGEPPPKDGKRPRLDEIDGLESVVARAMKAKPQERFADVRTLRQALAAVLSKVQKGSREPSGVIENLADALEPSAARVGADSPVAEETEARTSDEAPAAQPSTQQPGGSRRIWMLALLLAAAAIAAYVFLPRPGPDASRRPERPETTDASGDPDIGANTPVPEPHSEPSIATANAVDAGSELQVSPTAEDVVAETVSITVPDVGPSAGAPLASPMPDLLMAAIARAESGPPYTEPELGPLYGYATAHPDEARAHAVMGHVFVAMHWKGAAADAFARAARVDSGRWSDARVLHDLLLLAGTRDELFTKVWPPLRNRYGRAAIPQAQAALEQAPPAHRARLRRLVARLERLSAD